MEVLLYLNCKKEEEKLYKFWCQDVACGIIEVLSSAETH